MGKQGCCCEDVLGFVVGWINEFGMTAVITMILTDDECNRQCSMLWHKVTMMVMMMLVITIATDNAAGKRQGTCERFSQLLGLVHNEGTHTRVRQGQTEASKSKSDTAANAASRVSSS